MVLDKQDKFGMFQIGYEGRGIHPSHLHNRRWTDRRTAQAVVDEYNKGNL